VIWCQDRCAYGVHCACSGEYGVDVRQRLDGESAAETSCRLGEGTGHVSPCPICPSAERESGTDALPKTVAG
jgi:hypothetical protein